MPNELAFCYEAPYVKVSICRYSEVDVDCYLTAEQAMEAFRGLNAARTAQYLDLAKRAEAALSHETEHNPNFGSHPGTGN